MHVCARVCVQEWACFCDHLLLEELVGSEAFWIKASKDEPHLQQDLAPGADILQGCLETPLAGRG